MDSRAAFSLSQMHPELSPLAGRVAQRRDDVSLYVGLISSLLLAVWTSRKPNKCTIEIGLPFFFAGWANEEELLQHLDHPLNKNQGHERHK